MRLWLKPIDGQKRTRTEFLFLPKGIGREVRFWERASWIEEYNGFIGTWAAVRWVDGESE